MEGTGSLRGLEAVVGEFVFVMELDSWLTDLLGHVGIAVCLLDPLMLADLTWYRGEMRRATTCLRSKPFPLQKILSKQHFKVNAFIAMCPIRSCLVRGFGIS